MGNQQRFRASLTIDIFDTDIDTIKFSTVASTIQKGGGGKARAVLFIFRPFRLEPTTATTYIFLPNEGIRIFGVCDRHR